MPKTVPYLSNKSLKSPAERHLFSADVKYLRIKSKKKEEKKDKMEICRARHYNPGIFSFLSCAKLSSDIAKNMADFIQTRLHYFVI